MIEGQGFVLEQISEKPVTMIPMLFSGAFIKNHRGLKRAFIDEIYDEVADKSGLLSALMEMYAETISSLTDENEVEGNANWVVVK
jgi:hypothetical protein